ncbi:MAG TPA: M56 family metallopeptidase, partial [Candidatus Methylomirabilis sp.]|nr:M56 family metallopeptidase [Candidatus Methylomirabilis sp.]
MTAIPYSEQALPILLASAFKATVLLLCTWLFVFTLRKFSAAFRHHVWAAAILASLALPILIFVLPAWHSAALGNAAAFLGSSHAGAADSPSPAPTSTINVTAGDPLVHNWPFLLLLAWGLGFCFVALRLVAGLARLAWISARAKPLFDDCWMKHALTLSTSFRTRCPVRLLQFRNSLAMPLTWGFFRPVIILPSGADRWDIDRRSIVLSHEMAHIARNDWLLQICAELARALYWFHPLAWLAAAHLRRESERACDDVVLNSGIAPSTYASQLLDLARTLENSGRAWSTALAIARPSNLERRFAAMLNPSVNRRHLSFSAKFFIPFFALCVLLPLAALRLPAQNLSGKTSGSVHDPSGAGIANATIVMSNHDANTIDMTTSDRDGKFEFKGLPAGKYELQVFRPGFQTYRQSQVSLDPGQELTEVITLLVGAVSEHVTVV